MNFADIVRNCQIEVNPGARKVAICIIFTTVSHSEDALYLGNVATLLTDGQIMERLLSYYPRADWLVFGEEVLPTTAMP